MCAINAHPAYAGTWSIDPLNYTGDYADWQAQKGKRYSGAIKSEAEGFNSGQDPYPVRAGVQPTVVRTYERNFVNGSDERMDGGALVWRADISATPYAGAGEASSEGSVNLVLRYQPRQNYDNTTYSATPDPTDKPTGLLYLKVTVSPDVTARDGNGTQSYNVADKAHVSVSIVPGGDASSVKQDLAEQTIERTKVIHGQKTFYLKFDASDGGGESGPDGSTLYIVPLVSLKAKATLDRDRQTFRSSWNSTEWNEGRVGANMEVRAEMTQYFLSISSDLETSWKKLEGNLPDAYKKRIVDENGNWVLGPDPSKAQLVAKDLFGTNDIWRVVCSPGGSPGVGAVAVESAAEWKGTQWMGSAQFHANQSGFSSPTFAWTQPSGAMGGRTSDSSLDLTIADAGPGNYVQGINLGGDEGGQGITSTSNVSVKVTDPNLSLSSDYTVNWHVPNEWDSAPFATAPGPNALFAQQGYYIDSNGDTKTTLDANRTVNFQVDAPVTEFRIVTKGSVGAAGVLLGVGSAAAATAIVVTGIGSGPAGWLALALAVAGGGAGYVSGAMPAPTLDTKESNYAQYKADMIHQKLVDDARAIDPDAYPYDTPRSTNGPGFVAAAVNEINRVESDYGANADAHWNEDAIFNSSGISCTARAGRYTEVNSWRGDEYGHNGFVGKCLLDVTSPKSVFYVFSWTGSGSTPPPPSNIGGNP